MVKLFWTILLLVIPASGYAQFDSLGLNSKWNKGHIVLNDDRKLVGLIQSNERLRLIKFKVNDTNPEQSFLERNIKSYEYLDSDANMNRKFMRFNVYVADLGKTQEEVFELIYEFRDFAVLSKTFPVNPSVRVYSGGYGDQHAKMVGYEQYEGIFLVNVDGVAECLLMGVAVEKMKQRPNKSAKVQTVYQDKLLKKYVGDKWEAIRVFIKENKLKMKNKADVLRVFDYYAAM